MLNDGRGLRGPYYLRPALKDISHLSDVFLKRDTFGKK